MRKTNIYAIYVRTQAAYYERVLFADNNAHTTCSLASIGSHCIVRYANINRSLRFGLELHPFHRAPYVTGTRYALKASGTMHHEPFPSEKCCGTREPKVYELGISLANHG